MKFRLSYFVIILCLCCQSNDTQKANETLASKVDSIGTNSDFNGVVLVTKDSSIVYQKAIGYSDIENKTKLDLDDQFVIGSISKQITAVLVLREYEKGSIKLEEKLDTYLPDLNQDWAKQITVHQLLTHTHGIVDLNEPLAFESGSQFQYSQLGFMLLSKILENIKGDSFNEISTALFKEIGLKNTFHPDNKQYRKLVKGYEESQAGELEYVINSLENYASAGSFISNASDLNIWNQLLHSGKLVKKETLELMSKRYTTRIHPVFDEIEYGYGLLFKEGEENIEIGSFGYAPGFVSACYYYPQSGINLIVLENTARNLSDFKLTFKTQTDLMDLMKKEDEGL
jgi:D-alanyl-D-alanine carboxypeptidase